MSKRIEQVGLNDETYVLSEVLSSADSSNKVEDEGEGESDAPVIFLCGKCRLPFADSLSWAGSDDEQNEILLKRVNGNVVIGKEPFVYGTTEERSCLAVNLTCLGCNFILGHMYMSTPRSLDYKRSVFCFMVANVESYVLGSSDQQVAAVDREEMPVTFEYMDCVESEMTKVKRLAVTLGQRLLEIETELQSKTDN